MGLKFSEFFESSMYESSDTQIMVCKKCSSHLCLSVLIVSDQFSGASGSAYLVDNLINYDADPTVEETKMKTGVYLINKVRCHQCKVQVGWTYKKSFSYEESYKEGKFVIEKYYIKFIPNNSSTDVLLEQAKKLYNRRHLSSANSTASASSSISSVSTNSPPLGHFKFIGNRGLDEKSKLPIRRPNSIDFRDIHNGSFLSTLRFQGIDKDEFDDDKEDVIVDV
ncbi:uncharacterized protein PRCAT00004693001 [Priceomyces carsonii]|uniref:uncharacterized protein n=1 Tax=Priceomyces carsonii TaxID=28549 RepID=UPI002EDAEE6E|nr:unnamed protein product [Priceomyces carsonii]